MPIPHFREISPEVFETSDDPAFFGQEHIAALIEHARTAPRGRARLLLHASREDSLHEMVIALPSSNFDHPHINYKSGKSFLALSGQFALICFSDDGTTARSVVLSTGPWPGLLMAHLRHPTWHTIVPLQGNIVLLETIIGPFTGNKFASWFPEPDNKSRAEFVERVRQQAHDAANRLLGK